MVKKQKGKHKHIHLLLDGDIIAYRSAAAAEKSTDWGDGIHTIHALESDVRQIIQHTLGELLFGAKADSFYLCLTSSVNFRYGVWDGYKGHRKEVRRPMLLSYAKEYLNSLGDVKLLPKLEGDDVIGIYATWPDCSWQHVIWSPDKDLKTVPGVHYDQKTETIYEITEGQANKRWLTQVLTGDTSDGYPGCPGSGPKDAEKVLSEIPDDDLPGMWKAVVKRYEKAHLTEEDALVQARLSRILRYGEYDLENSEVKLWSPPDAKNNDNTKHTKKKNEHGFSEEDFEF